MAEPSAERPGCLTALLRLFTGQPKTAETFPYRVRDDFLSPAELSFSRVLQSVVNERAVIYPKVRLADIFFITQRDGYRSYFNRISAKHVDFLLCDPKSIRPLAGIELDDSSHAGEDRKDRDAFVNSVFDAAQLPLFRMSARRAYTVAELATQIEPLFTLTTTPVQPQPTPTQSDTPRCPKCGIPMILRTASRGPNQGKQFYGCRNYPRCQERLPAT